MDAVKAKSPMTVQPTEAPKRTQQVQSETAQIQASQASASQKAAYEQPKPTTNTQGQQLGQRLNAIA